jgi:exosortase
MSIAVAPPQASEVVRSPAETGTRTVLRRAVLILVAAELLFLYAPTWRWLVDRWTMGVWNNAHGFMIPPVVAWFVWQELRPLRALPPDANAWGLALLVPALAMHVLDTGMHTQILSATSIVVALPGLSLLFLGTARTKAIAFPLALTLLMLPIPLAMTERIHLVLRHVSTAGAAAIIPWLGGTVYAEATTLHITQGVLEVGDGCSGFSTLYAACAVAALAAYSSDRWSRRIAALAAAAPLAIASNIVRVVLLVFVVRWLGMGALETWLHPASGVLTFVLTLPVILWLGRPAGQGVRS